MAATANLNRFIVAQAKQWGGYELALREMNEGHKRSHWIWYIFPQIHGMGHSEPSKYYAISSLEEARAYLENETLGPRLREITRAVLSHRKDSIETIMGSQIDAIKLRSSMTLFDLVSPDDVFSEVLEVFFDGERDSRTLRIVSH